MARSPQLPVSSLHQTRLNAGMTNRAPISGTALFLSFLIIGCTSIGGGLTAWIRRELVERRGWIDDQQFLANYGLSQMVPGATNVNLAVLIGAQLRGARGALIALAGLLLVPLAILLALGGFYFAAHGASHATLLNTALAGAGAVAIGFNVATGIRLGLANIRRLGPALIAAAIVVAIGVIRIPLLEVLLVAIPASLALTLLQRSR
jgi:chromate transporter